MRWSGNITFFCKIHSYNPIRNLFASSVTITINYKTIIFIVK